MSARGNMKVKECAIKLGWNGKPELYFHVEAENELERSALKAMEFYQYEHHNDRMKDIHVVTVEIEKKDDSMRVWTSSQISQQAFAERENKR